MSKIEYTTKTHESQYPHWFSQLPKLPLYAPTDGGCACGNPACKSPGKHPVTDWDKATTDVAQVKAWLESGYNLGVLLRPGCGVVVLDIDPRNKSEETLARLGLTFPTTPTVITGGGGWHYYFAAPDHIKENDRLGAGVELKVNGVVVIPPSLHASGKEYVWNPDAGLEVPLATLPLQLYPRMRAGDQGVGWEWLGRPVPEGERHKRLVGLAGLLRRRNVPQDIALALLHAWNRRWCVPPESEEEVERQVLDVYARYTPQAQALAQSFEAFSQQAGEISWLWEGWLARGVVTILAGRQGVGKTSFALWLSGWLAERGCRTLYIPAEGSGAEIAEKIKRLGAQGAILTRERGDFLTVARDWDDIVQEATGYDLIILDSLTAHALDDLRKAERARRVMNKLAELALGGAAVLVTHHLRKQTLLDPVDDVTQDMVRDSQDLLAAARCVWGVWEDEEGYLVLRVLKSNLAARPRGLRFALDDKGMELVGEAPERERELGASGWERCAEWLREYLREGPKRSDEVRRAAMERGYTGKQLRRARDAVVRRIEKLPSGHTLWSMTE